MDKRFRPVAKGDMKAVFVKAIRFEKYETNKWRLENSENGFYLNLANVDYIYGDASTNIRFGNPKNPEYAQISERSVKELMPQLLARGIDIVDLDAEAAELAPAPRKLKPAF
jgi:hypothetical protein